MGLFEVVEGYFRLCEVTLGLRFERLFEVRSGIEGAGWV